MRLRRRHHGTRVALTTGGLLFVREHIDDVQRSFRLEADAAPVILHPVSAYNADFEPITPEPTAVRIEHVQDLRPWDATPRRHHV